MVSVDGGLPLGLTAVFASRQILLQLGSAPQTDLRSTAFVVWLSRGRPCVLSYLSMTVTLVAAAQDFAIDMLKFGLY